MRTDADWWHREYLHVCDLRAADEQRLNAEADDRWKKAAATVRAWYPEDVFTPDGTTPDAAAARLCRHLCDEIVRIATEEDE